MINKLKSNKIMTLIGGSFIFILILKVILWLEDILILIFTSHYIFNIFATIINGKYKIDSSLMKVIKDKGIDFIQNLLNFKPYQGILENMPGDIGVHATQKINIIYIVISLFNIILFTLLLSGMIFIILKVLKKNNNDMEIVPIKTNIRHIVSSKTNYDKTSRINRSRRVLDIRHQ